MPPKKKNDDALAEGVSFEAITSRLEAITQALEQGEKPLEESIALFEEGIRLARVGTERLDDAEARIEKLMRDGATVPTTLAGDVGDVD